MVPPEMTTGDPRPGEKARFLVVDDEPYQLMFMEKALQALGFVVSTAGTAEEAAQKLHSSEYDILLTDMFMPDHDGVWLVTEARKTPHGKSLSIFLVTALKSIQNVTEAMRAGADGYILKPIELDLMKVMVHRELQVRAVLAENARLREENSRLTGKP